MMKVIVILFLLCFLYSCNNCPDNYDFRKRLPTVEIINSALLKNLKQLNWKNDIEEISKNFPQIINPLLEIKTKIGFIQVELYYINGDSNRIGLAYVFKKGNGKSTQYLLYTVNPADKGNFITYEQFIEYRRDIVEFNAFWTYCCIDNDVKD